MLRVTFIIFLLSVLLGIVFLYAGYPIVIDRSNNLKPGRSPGYQKGDTIRPFEHFDFSKGNWSAYIIIPSSDDAALSRGLSPGAYTTSDKKLLSGLSTLDFVCIGGDIATCLSGIILYHDGKAIFKSGIVLDATAEGLQNRTFGWMAVIPSGALSSECRKFDKVLSPILLLK